MKFWKSDVIQYDFGTGGEGAGHGAAGNLLNCLAENAHGKDLLRNPGAGRTGIKENEDGRWKIDFSNVERMSEQEIAERKARFARDKEIARQVRAEAGLKVGAAE